MITIVFPDKSTENRARGLLASCFSDRALASGEHIVPEAALAALANEDIPFTVRGRATPEQEMESTDNACPEEASGADHSLSTSQEPESRRSSFLAHFLYGMSTVLEIFPPVERSTLPISVNCSAS